MSYEIEVRSKPAYAQGVPFEEMVSALLSMPNVIQMDSTAFAIDRADAGLNLIIDIGHEAEKGVESDVDPPDYVNYVAFLVESPFVEKSGPLAADMAFQIADRFRWTVYDPQQDREVLRGFGSEAWRFQRSSDA